MKRPELRVVADAEEFVARVTPFLEKHEAENGLFLGVLGQSTKSAPDAAPFMAWVQDGGEVRGAALDGGRNLILTDGVGPVMDALVSGLISRDARVPGVVGPAREAEEFATAWGAARSCEPYLAMDQGIYKLTQIIRPSGIPGRIRPMMPGDVDLIADWLEGFHRESLPNDPFDLQAIQKSARTRPAQGTTFIWETEQRPVAMASLTRPTRAGVTVNAVYTPPAHRRRGYATALVAAVSQEGLSRGKQFCVLYTDLLNPTSNSIYQKIGYRRLSSSRNFRFRSRERA